MSLAYLKSAMGDRDKVNVWLDSIGETDQACRAEVLERCAKDSEARAYYVMRYEERQKESTCTAQP